MPTVTYDRQSFLIDSRRVWVLGASMAYARVDPADWPRRLGAIRQSGCNLVEVPCPWGLHEPRKGKYDFEGGLDLSGFLQAASAAGLYVALRVGPYVGAGLDGGGLPAWLVDDPAIRLREADPAFLERVSRFHRKLVAQFADLQASKGGPVLLVQVEHEWMCANETEGEKYLGELSRVLRESGVSVPLTNTNNLWLEPRGTIDAWLGSEDLLVNLRQLRVVQPDAPRVVTVVDENARLTWGDKPPAAPDPEARLHRLAAVLAAGGQPILAPFHGGTNFGFRGGRRAGSGAPYLAAAAWSAPLGEAGARGRSYRLLRRLLTFADQFGSVFGEFDPDDQAVIVDPDALAGRDRPGATVVPLRGAAGRIVFVFTHGSTKSVDLILGDGERLPIDLREQRVGWYAVDVDLGGHGRLDYANLCPFAIVGNRVILHGPPRSDVIVSINGAATTTTVPSGGKPRVVEHKGIQIVVVSHEAVDATYFDEDTIYVGVDGLDPDGGPRLGQGSGKAWAVGPDGSVRSFTPQGATTRPKATGKTTPKNWTVADGTEYSDGASARYASLPGAQSLTACGAPTGYGWYRMNFKATKAGKRKLHLPGSGHRLHLWINGVSAGVVGIAPGAEPAPIDVSFPKGDATVVLLADNLGRLSEGNDLEHRVGVVGTVAAVAPLKGVKTSKVTADAVDPFALRGFIAGGAQGRMSQVEQIVWTFSHAKKTPIIVSVEGAARGTFVLNDVPQVWYAGATGVGRAHYEFDPASEAFKRGKNVLRFAPDADETDAAAIAKDTRLFECVESIGADASWSFAKWETPAATRFQKLSATEMVKRRGGPAWWRTHANRPGRDEPVWFDAKGLSKGVVYVNGAPIGRYFTATATGKAVGPQTRLLVPDALFRDGPNEIIVFDEHGFSPSKTTLVCRPAGDLDES